MDKLNKNASDLQTEQSLVASNSLYYFFRFLSKSFIAFVVSIFLVRFLGSIDYGIYTIATTYWVMFTTIASIGLGSAVQYGIAKYRSNNELGKLNWLVRHYLKILTISSILGSIVMFLLAGPIAIAYRVPEIKSLIEILSVGIVFYAITESFAANVYIGFQKMKYTFWSGIVFDALRLVQVSIVFFGLGLLGVITFYDVIYVIVTVISLYFVYRLLHKNNTQKEIPIPKKELSEFHRYNWFSYGNNLIAYFYGSAIALILGVFAPNLSSVSFFTVGLSLASLISMPAGALSSAFFSTNTKYFEKKQFDKFYEFMNLILRYVSMFTIPLAVGGIIAAGPLISYFYRSSFLGAEIPFIIAMVATFLTALFNPLTNVVSAIGKQKYILYSSVVGAVVGLISTLILVPIFLTIGAAFVILLSSVAILVVNLYYTSRYIKIILPYLVMFKITIASLIMGGLIYLLDKKVSLSLLPFVLIGSFIVYLFIIYAMRVLTKNDINFFLKLSKLDKFLHIKT